jgi:hypothetical protein
MDLTADKSYHHIMLYMEMFKFCYRICVPYGNAIVLDTKLSASICHLLHRILDQLIRCKVSLTCEMHSFYKVDHLLGDDAMRIQFNLAGP